MGPRHGPPAGRAARARDQPHRDRHADRTAPGVAAAACRAPRRRPGTPRSSYAGCSCSTSPARSRSRSCSGALLAFLRGTRARQARGGRPARGAACSRRCRSCSPAPSDAQLRARDRVRGRPSCCSSIAAFGKSRDLGAQIGIVAARACRCSCTRSSAIGAKYLWPDAAFDGPGVIVAARRRPGAVPRRADVAVLFAPRPFARAVDAPGAGRCSRWRSRRPARSSRARSTRRSRRPRRSRSASSSTTTQADPRLALYLLAIATLAWTLASCAFAASAARRADRRRHRARRARRLRLPLAASLPAAAARARARSPMPRAACARRSSTALPISTETPPIADPAWSGVHRAGAPRASRRRSTAVQTLSMRGEAGSCRR